MEVPMPACTLAPRLPRLDARIHPIWPIMAMVGGFALWWPIGLLVLALWKGAPLLGLRIGPDRPAGMPRWIGGSTGNTAFDEHREAVLRRLEEERRALDDQQRAFGDFLQQLRRAR